MPGSFRSTGARRGRCPLLRCPLFPATAAAIDGADRGRPRGGRTAARPCSALRAPERVLPVRRPDSMCPAPRPSARLRPPECPLTARPGGTAVRCYGRSFHPAQQHAPRQHTRPQTPQPPQPKPPTHPASSISPAARPSTATALFPPSPAACAPAAHPARALRPPEPRPPAIGPTVCAPRRGGRRGATGARAGVLGLPSLGSPVPFAGLGGPLGRPGPCLCGRPGLCRSSATASRGRRWRWCARPGG